jgi:hypothetical protein
MKKVARARISVVCTIPVGDSRMRYGGTARMTLVTGLFYTLTSTLVLAHHPGGIGNTGSAGPIVTISASTLEQGRSVAGVSLIYSDFSHLSDATLINATAAGIEDVHGLDTIQSYALSYAYGLTHDLMIGFRLPYQKRTGIRAAEEDPPNPIEVEDHGGSTGIGDVSFFGQYRFLNDKASQTEAAIILGLKAPTGPTDRKSPHGELLDAEFQPGSGSWDGLFGVAITRRIGRWSFDANALYNLVTDGTQSTDLGDQFLYNAAISYRLAGFSGTSPMFHGAHSHEDGDDGHHHAHDHHDAMGPTLDFVLEMNGEWHDKQNTHGIDDDNSGGNTLYLAPGLRLANGTWSSYASFGIPIVTDENGIQPEPDWRLSTGVSVGF